MKKIGIVYGSTTGTTEGVAEKIAAQFAGSDMINAGELDDAFVTEHDVLILGSSTWGSGELQDDWYDGVEVLKSADLSGKKVALFGCGDGSTYSDTFCDAMGLIYDEIKDKGIELVGKVSTAGYSFDSSVSATDDMFIGLAIDEDNEGNLTDERVSNWVAQINAVL